MAPIFRYSHPTTPAGTGFDDDIGAVVPWGSIDGLTTMAQAGESAISSIHIDDVSGTANFRGLHRFRFIETEASTDPVWNGYIAEQKVGRMGANERFVTGASRSWELSLTDDNSILAFRVVSGDDGNRGVESGSARLAWLISTNYLGDVVDDGFVDYPGTAYVMDATDYRGQYGRDVLGDIALQCGGVNFFAQYNLSVSGTSTDIGLWFGDSNTSTAFASTSAISNEPGTADGTAIFAPSDDTVLVRDPSRIAAGVYLPYSGGAIYAYDYATSYDFAFRDQVAPTATITTEAQGTALADQFLATFDEQDEKVTTTIWVPPANLYDIRAGHLITLTATHLPGYELGRTTRVLRKTISNFDTSLGLYEVGLELSPTQTLYVGDVAAVYQRSENYPTGYYADNADNPEPGWLSIPRRGPIAYDQSSAPFYSFTVSANMLARLTALMAWSGVVDEYTITLSIKVNGVTVGSDSSSHSGGLGYWQTTLSVDVRNHLLFDGDVISAVGSPDGGWTNFAVNGTYFIVGRGYISELDWTGP